MRLPLMICLLGFVTSCQSAKLTEEDCNNLLGRGIGLSAYANTAEVPVDVASVRSRARGPVKTAIDSFDKACRDKPDDGARQCGRAAHNAAEFRGCGGLVAIAFATGEIAKDAVVRRYDADSCARYAEAGVRSGAGLPDDASRFHRECDGALEVGVYRCRVAAKDAATWKACAE